MLLVADVHGAFGALRRVAATGQPLLVLGDLLNFVDYRTMDGIAADIFGREFVGVIARARGRGDYEASRRMWIEHSTGREDEIRSRVAELVWAQYADCAAALAGSEAYVTYGNVDWPSELEASLPPGCRFVDGEAIELGGLRIGIVGGGAPTAIRARGEVTDEQMAAKLERLGDVDVLCSHLAPPVPPLYRDVITGALEQASPPLLDYIRRVQPSFHYFGDIHQPQATRWRVGRTLCVNVGYFRATGRAVRHT